MVRRLADEWGMAILVVEHDMNFVMGVCDQVVVLDFGEAHRVGLPEEVRSDPAVIAAYLGDLATPNQRSTGRPPTAPLPAPVAGGSS